MSNSLYEERLARIRKAVALEPVDKIPIAPCANAYWANQQGVPMKDYITNFELACTTNIDAMQALGGVDATQNVIFSPYLLGTQWLSKVAVPGKELGDNELWQVIECENMKAEDYDDILQNGFEDFYLRFMKERVDDNFTKLQPFFDYMSTAYKRFHEASIPCICDFLMITPFEFFCGGRSLECFFLDDLMKEPDKMDKVFALTMEYTLKDYRQKIIDSHATGVWIGGWRTAPSMISPAMWDRFVWPYFKKYTELCVEMDVIPIFHLDSDWTLALERFKELPAKKCILALDSKTDIRKARKILDGHMCILGDVPAELLAFGTYDEVYAHTHKLIDDIGPVGYIVASGCDIPSNAKKENVQAMCDAANNYFVDEARH